MKKKLFERRVKKIQKTNQANFRTKNLIQEKDDALHLKQKAYGKSFNSWIDTNDIIASNELLPSTR